LDNDNKHQTTATADCKKSYDGDDAEDFDGATPKKPVALIQVVLTE
jgi:hypothetical protein